MCESPRVCPTLTLLSEKELPAPSEAACPVRLPTSRLSVSLRSWCALSACASSPSSRFCPVGSSSVAQRDLYLTTFSQQVASASVRMLGLSLPTRLGVICSRAPVLLWFSSAPLSVSSSSSECRGSSRPVSVPSQLSSSTSWKKSAVSWVPGPPNAPLDNVASVSHRRCHPPHHMGVFPALLTCVPLASFPLE